MDNLIAITAEIGQRLELKNYRLAIAESCTGGLLSASLIALPGCSTWFDRGFVAYSDEAKIECLGVEQQLIADYGAVSEQVAKGMAQGAINNSQADIALATTGIAGPSGGSDEKPVGLVWFALANKHKQPILVQQAHFSGDRYTISRQAVEFAIRLLQVADL